MGTKMNGTGWGGEWRGGGGVEARRKGGFFDVQYGHPGEVGAICKASGSGRCTYSGAPHDAVLRCSGLGAASFAALCAVLCCRWVIFNDEKVAESEHPPRDLGYLYLFKRVDQQ